LIGCRLGKACLRGRVPLAVALLMLLGTMAVELASGPISYQTAQSSSSRFHGTPTSVDSPKLLSAFGSLPMFFERNLGQTDPSVKFLARGSGYSLFLTSDAAVLTMHHHARKAGRMQTTSEVLRMSLLGANRNARIDGAGELPGRSNYFIGNDPAKWQHDVPHFSRVRYRSVYPGVDLVYYGSGSSLEYDFEVDPGADPEQVELSFEGARGTEISSNGDLVLHLDGGSIRFHAPQVYQYIDGQKRSVSGRFESDGKNGVRFALGAYDRSRMLVIDPLLSYSTYLGGSKDEACSVILGTGTPISGCPAVAVDAALDAYLVGITDSTDFPPQPGVLGSLKGTANIFVTKFNPTANTLLFSTYIGGNGIDYTAGVAVDPGFDVFVAGTTSSTNFPTSSGAFQATPLSTNNHVFVTELDPTGHTLRYSTYLSGNGVDTASGIALDFSGNAYVSGTTTSNEQNSGFPSTLGAFQTASRATHQFFLTKLNPTLSGVDSVPYSTYFGGSTPSSGETLGGGVAVDSSANVYITGGTNFTDLPMLNAEQSLPKVGIDAFVAKISPAAITGTQLIYSTYIGGSGDDIGYGVAVDPSLNAYITGSTTSTDFPAAGTGVFQSGPSGGTDAFLAKFGVPCTGTGCTNTNVPLSYSTYLGGSGEDVGLAIALDNTSSPTNNNQGARIAGWTNSSDFHTFGLAVQGGYGGGSDAFVARIDTTATSPTAQGHYSVYLGGSGNDYGTGIASDLQGASYVAGETNSSDFLTNAPPLGAQYQSLLQGSTDAFLSKLSPLLAFTLTVNASPTTVGVGGQVTFTYTITNAGDFTSGITFTDNLTNGNAASFVSATANTGTNACGQPNGGTVLCNIGTLNAGATATVTIVLTPIAPTPPATKSVTLSNNGFVGVGGSSLASAQTTVNVNDFDIAVAPSSATVAAGVPASYTVTVTPTGSIPASVSLSCSAGLPTGSTCSETTNPIPNLDTGSASSTVLVINTTARVTTTTQWLRGKGPIYAGWLPISGLALMGAGMAKASRKRRALTAMLLVGFFALIFFQPGCGGKSSTTTVTGTPAGTYLVTVSASSGSSNAAVRTKTVTLIVQ